MRVYRPKEGQRRYGGHVVHLAQNSGGFVSSLQRAARSLTIVSVRRQDGEGTHKNLMVRRQRAFDALNWLRANNSFNSDVRVDADNLAALLDNDPLQNLYVSCGDDDLDSERDTGPEQDYALGGGGGETRSSSCDRSSETVCRRTQCSTSPAKNGSGTAPQNCYRRWLPYLVRSLCRPTVRHGGHAPQRIQNTRTMYLVFACSIPVRLRASAAILRRIWERRAIPIRHTSQVLALGAEHA